jgi:hypothetical protein
MRDLAAPLTSFVNIDRASLVAMLISEAAAADRLAASVRKRAMVSRQRRSAAIDRAARVNRLLSFFRDGETSPDYQRRPATRATVAPPCWAGVVHY